MTAKKQKRHLCDPGHGVTKKIRNTVKSHTSPLPVRFSDAGPPYPSLITIGPCSRVIGLRSRVIGPHSRVIGLLGLAVQSTFRSHHIARVQ